MKKILYIPFFSQQNKVTQRFLLNSCANMAIMKNILSLLKDFFHITIMKPYDFLCEVYVENLFSSLASEVHEKVFIPNNVAQRFDFNFIDWYNYFLLNKFDLVINNTPELTKNILSCYKHANGNFPRIISFNHFAFFHDTDLPGHDKRINYFARQLEAIHCSDLFNVCSTYIRDRYRDYVSENDEKKIVSWPVIFDSYAIQKEFFETKEIQSVRNYKHPQKVIFIFPNRLSSTNYSCHMQFIEAINILKETHPDFNVIFTNTTKTFSDDWLEENVHGFIRSDGYQRKDYLKLLAKSDFAISLLSEYHGGVAIREASALGCVPIVRRIFSFEKTIPQSYPFFINSLEPEHIASVLRLAYKSKMNDGLYFGDSYRSIFEEEDFAIHSAKVLIDVNSVLAKDVKV